MDCLDCQNRPAHTSDLPENAVDKQMSIGAISPDLPYIRKKAVEVLKVNYTTREVAQHSITSEIIAFYQTSYPEIDRARRPAAEQASQEMANIYLRNIFPDLGHSPK
jgi:hypothetical protein